MSEVLEGNVIRSVMAPYWPSAPNKWKGGYCRWNDGWIDKHMSSGYNTAVGPLSYFFFHLGFGEKAQNLLFALSESFN